MKNMYKIKLPMKIVLSIFIPLLLLALPFAFMIFKIPVNISFRSILLLSIVSISLFTTIYLFVSLYLKRNLDSRLKSISIIASDIIDNLESFKYSWNKDNEMEFLKLKNDYYSIYIYLLKYSTLSDDIYRTLNNLYKTISKTTVYN